MNFEDDEMYELVHQWTSHLGYFDGRIDLKITDLSSFATDTCSLIAYAPLWGAKPGLEKPIPASEVRKNLAKSLRWARVSRHDMHIARHPTKSTLCLFFVVKIRPVFLPINIMTVPLAFIVKAVATENGLRIDQIEERAVQSPLEAKALLIDTYGWPDTTLFERSLSFGAVS